jgi:hypothetical protein
MVELVHVLAKRQGIYRGHMGEKITNLNFRNITFTKYGFAREGM